MVEETNSRTDSPVRFSASTASTVEIFRIDIFGLPEPLSRRNWSKMYTGARCTDNRVTNIEICVKALEKVHTVRSGGLKYRAESSIFNSSVFPIERCMPILINGKSTTDS